MILSKTKIKTLHRLENGETIPASSLSKDMEDMLLSEGLLTVIPHGSRRSFKAINTSALKQFLISQFEEFCLDEHDETVVDGEHLSRAKQALFTGNSKLIAVRSCPGFPVNSYEKIKCKLNGNDFIVAPQDGSFLFISDWEKFSIPEEIVIIGIENMENFRMIRMQKMLFKESLINIGLNADTPILFVSRYPQSADLHLWLQMIHNPYIHFGDFDLAGINIFLTEFKKYLGPRSHFLIPNDIESRIIGGTSKRYNDQYEKFHNISSSDPDIQYLIGIINKYHRCYDQEGYIT